MSNHDSLQKIADAVDLFRTDFFTTICDKLRIDHWISPRIWEYAATYLALENNGFFGRNRNGIGFGCGREPLIFAIAERCENLLVTDLYNETTEWDVAKTADCRSFVLDKAPKDFDPKRIDVESADMRKTRFQSGAFDFAYSISSFEHIGQKQDFVDHLREVKRLLKPNGAYVFTTELRIDRDFSHPIIGNYAFGYDELIALFKEAGLCPEVSFDHRLNNISLNAASEPSGAHTIDPASAMLDQFIVRETGGVMSLPSLFILRNREFATPQVIGRLETKAWLTSQLENRTNIRFADWCLLNPFASQIHGRSSAMDFWDCPPSEANQNLIFATRYAYFGMAEMQIRVKLVRSKAIDDDFTFTVAIMSWSLEDISDMLPIETKIVTFNHTMDDAQVLLFQFPSQSNRCYSAYALQGTNNALLSDVSIMARRAK